MTSRLVIGAGYGDEGKGIMTHALTMYHGADIVCRFNGGAQAGHTVKTGDYRHVFHHFGSSTLEGNDTYLAPEFIVNPFLYWQERKELQRKITGLAENDGRSDFTPTIVASGDCRVTTFAEMLLNEIVEDDRGVDRHGSCGVGIYETVLRNNAFSRLNVDALYRLDAGGLEAVVRNIVREWVPQRLEELKIDPARHSQKMEWINSQTILDNWVHEARKMVNDEENFLIRSPSWLKGHDVTYEGAQGLLLDQNNSEFFPHLTPSNTGSNNVIKMVRDYDLEVPKIFYVTRTYMTRHGAGPFPTETPGLTYHDDTNNPNPWQGSLRFGVLDVERMRAAIHKDVAKWFTPGKPLRYCCAVTHTDSAAGNGYETARRISAELDLPLGASSSGPDYDDVTFY